MAVGGAAQLPRRRLSVCRAPAKETPRDRGLTGAMDPGAASPTRYYSSTLPPDVGARETQHSSRASRRRAARHPRFRFAMRTPLAQFDDRGVQTSCDVVPWTCARQTAEQDQTEALAEDRREFPNCHHPFVARRTMCELLVADVSSSSPTREPLDEARRAPDRRKLSTESQDQTVSTSTCVLRTRVRRGGKERGGT